MRVKELFPDEEPEESGRDGCGGKEVNEVPLCAPCVVEVEIDGVKEESVAVRRGLRRVEKVDGGLTRKRWEANHNKSNSKVGYITVHQRVWLTGRSIHSRGNRLFNKLEIESLVMKAWPATPPATSEILQNQLFGWTFSIPSMGPLSNQAL